MVSSRGARSGSIRAFALASALILLAATGCAPPDAEPPTLGPDEGYSHPMVGLLAPEFTGEAPGGNWMTLKGLRGQPVAILFFRTSAPLAREMALEFSRFYDDPSLAPTVFIGLCTDEADQIQRFAKTHRTRFPIFRAGGTVAHNYDIGSRPTIILLDGHQVVRFRLAGQPGSQFRARIAAIEAALRDLPNLPAITSPEINLAYGEAPRAPLFTASDLDGRPFDLAALRGRVVVINFFDQKCTHCQSDLPRLVPVLKEYREHGVVSVGIASRDVAGEMRQFLQRHGIDYPVIIDPAREIFNRFGSTRTPDTFIIDRDGFIRFRESGDRPDRAALTRLQLRIALAEETPEAIAASLPPGRFVGGAICATCHEREYRDWLMTPHSIAWESLQKGDKWRDPECVACHVTGHGRPGGYSEADGARHLVNVQCEVCHGPGGGHPEGAPLDLDAMLETCETCHTGKFVLNFDLDEATLLVSHQDQPDLEKLFRYSDLQRLRLEEINKRRLEKFKSGVAHVGAEACRDCHREEFDQWNRTPHAAAYVRLVKRGRGSDPSCTPCHTTGSGMRAGFGSEDATTLMTNVQCEVCHGPGEDHVNASPERMKETIYGITDQCSFCIIQGLCATCHDAENDPDFDIEKALPLVRH